MSAHDHTHDNHAHDAGHEPVKLRDYLTGFGLSVVLTAIPFWLVMTGALSTGITMLLIMGFAAVQMLVHMIYFLHMSPKSQGGWTLMALIFTLVLVVITLSGSLWVMYHLNTNMMPSMTVESARQVP